MKQKIAQTVAKWLGMDLIPIPRFAPEEIVSAVELIAAMEKKQAASGEFKRNKTIAGLMNRHSMKQQRASLLVELVLCGAVS